MKKKQVKVYNMGLVKDQIVNLTDPKDPRRFSAYADHVHINGVCVKNRRWPRCQPPPKKQPPIRIRKTAYSAKRLDGANVLPHGVRVSMTTLRDGRARWAYTETFRKAQFPSLKAARDACADTLTALRALAESIDQTMRIRVHGLRITISGTSSREAFSDSMVSEFLAWGGKLGDMSIRKFLTAAMRFMMAGWQP